MEVLIRSVLKGGMENDAGVIEDKTEVGGTETESECSGLPDIVAMAIWVPGNSNFFSKKVVRELCV